jgi:hypothetical protein
MRDSPIAIALMVFSGRSPRQAVVAESLNASRNLRDFPACRRRFQTQILAKLAQLGMLRNR